MIQELKTYTKGDRLQYRLDTKALICRSDILDVERKRIQNGLYVEDGMFYVSRLYVPFSLFSLYRKGTFNDQFQSAEFKHIFRIVIVMQLLDIAGHFMLRYMTRPLVTKYVALNEHEFASKRKQNLDDYIIQKNYFREKKEAKKMTRQL